MTNGSRQLSSRAKSILSVAVVLLTACVPVVSYEYDVKGQGDKSESGGCSPTTEVRLTTHLTRATDAVFWGSVERLHHSHRIVSISFTFTDDEAVYLTTPEVTVTSNAYAKPHVVPISGVRRSSRLNSPSCDPPDGSSFQRPDQPLRRMQAQDGDAATDSVFTIDIAVPDNPAQFTIQLSPVQVNGRIIEVPPVTFLRQSSVSFPAIM